MKVIVSCYPKLQYLELFLNAETLRWWKWYEVIKRNWKDETFHSAEYRCVFLFAIQMKMSVLDCCGNKTERLETWQTFVFITYMNNEVIDSLQSRHPSSIMKQRWKSFLLFLHISDCTYCSCRVTSAYFSVLTEECDNEGVCLWLMQRSSEGLLDLVVGAASRGDCKTGKSACWDPENESTEVLKLFV